MKRQKILLLFGAQSTEHEVSVRSAASIYQAIDRSKYKVLLCYIDQRGVWWLLDDWQDVINQPIDGLEVVVDESNKKLIIKQYMTEVTSEIIMPVLHGQFGEDGTVQALAESIGIPIVGCGSQASKICWDKAATKQALANCGIKTVPYFEGSSSGKIPTYQQLAAELSSVLFVKPARSGSSLGVSRVSSQDELDQAVKLALKHDDKLLIEMAIVGRELEVGVLGNPPNHIVTGVGEIRPGEEFYSYEDKYNSHSNAEVIVDAGLPDAVTREIQQIAHRAYAALGCRGLSRVDFLLSDDGIAYVNEVNTFPGFTSISQYPKLWQAAGVSYPELIDRLVESAIQRD